VTDRLLVHATAVAIDGGAVLLRGPPGCGKSDLALRLIDRGAQLIADDQALLVRRDAHILVRAPATIATRSITALPVDGATTYRCRRGRARFPAEGIEPGCVADR